MRQTRRRTYLQNGIIGVAAALCVAGRYVPSDRATGPVAEATAAMVPSVPSMLAAHRASSAPASAVSLDVATALDAFSGVVGPLSHPKALEDAFQSYFTYRNAHPDAVRKPYLYFVDYGLPSTTPRGYLFDMATLAVVEGPFTVAHGRGSSLSRYGVPSRFSNAMGSASTSLGLYLAQELYGFRGKSAGQSYSSIGMRLMGLSRGSNDNARSRGVVAHGAPYVTAARAGRSEGCPAVEPTRAARILPKLANGGMVYLFAPDPMWMSSDPWLAGGANG